MTVQQFTVKTLKILLLEEQSQIADNYQNLELYGDVKITRTWNNPSKTNFAVFFDLIDKGESISCAYWTKSKKEMEKVMQFDKKNCLLRCKLDVNKIFQNFQLNVQNIDFNETTSKLDLLKKQCEEKGLLHDKKNVDWNSVKKIGVISKKNTQGHSDFINQLQIPFEMILEEVPLEGPQTASEIIKKIEQFNSLKEPLDVILLIRGGGNTTEIANSFDKIELFETMKQSRIPIVTAIGHHNDTDENLFITKISDVDYPTPTSLAKCINSSIFDTLYNSIGQKIQSIYQKFLTLMNEKQYKILLDIQKEVDIWIQQFSNYHVVDLSNVPPNKEIVFLMEGKYYKQTIDTSKEINIDEKELKKKETIMSFLNKNEITSLLKMVEQEKIANKTILKLCHDWIKNETESKEFINLKPISIENWKDLTSSSKSISKLQKQKQMYSHIQENILYHPMELEVFHHLQKL